MNCSAAVLEFLRCWKQHNFSRKRVFRLKTHELKIIEFEIVLELPALVS